MEQFIRIECSGFGCKLGASSKPLVVNLRYVVLFGKAKGEDGDNSGRITVDGKEKYAMCYLVSKDGLEGYFSDEEIAASGTGSNRCLVELYNTEEDLQERFNKLETVLVI